jgi:hypothetical protein
MIGFERWAVVLDSLLAGAAYTWFAGEDINWDWRNYREYGAFAPVSPIRHRAGCGHCTCAPINRGNVCSTSTVGKSTPRVRAQSFRGADGIDIKAYPLRPSASDKARPVSADRC